MTSLGGCVFKRIGVRRGYGCTRVVVGCGVCRGVIVVYVVVVVAGDAVVLVAGIGGCSGDIGRMRGRGGGVVDVGAMETSRVLQRCRSRLWRCVNVARSGRVESRVVALFVGIDGGMVVDEVDGWERVGDEVSRSKVETVVHTVEEQHVG